jgi:hypothetical protein
LYKEPLSVTPRRTAARRHGGTAARRALCNRAARVYRQGQDQGAPREEFASLHDISAGGVCLRLEERFPRDTVLVVEPVSPGPRTLLARVVRSVVEDGGWLHGCLLSSLLSAEDLCGWLGSGADSLPNPNPTRTADESRPVTAP